MAANYDIEKEKYRIFYNFLVKREVIQDPYDEESFIQYLFDEFLEEQNRAGADSNSKPANCAIFDVSGSLPFEFIKKFFSLSEEGIKQLTDYYEVWKRQ